MSKRLGGGIIGCKYKTSLWHLNGFFPDGSNIGSTVSIIPGRNPSLLFCFLKKNQNAPRPSEHPPVRGKNNVKTFGWDHNRLLFRFVFVLMLSLMKPRSFVQSFFVLR